MGKKEVNKGSNTDVYRKRIGKQEYKMNKKNVKTIKEIADTKHSRYGIRDALLLLLAFTVLLASIYLAFYLFLDVEFQ